MGECVDETGHVGNCPHEGLSLLAIIGVTASLCLLITWATNRMIRTLAKQGRGATLGVTAGFGLGVALVVMLYMLLITLT
jgi:hypothetical protein